MASAMVLFIADWFLANHRQLPPLPVPARVRARVPDGKKVTAVMHLPERKLLKFKAVGPYVQFDLEPFTALSMSLIEYE